jgi:hypothetical protein
MLRQTARVVMRLDHVRLAGLGAGGLDFGNVAIGDSGSRSFTLTNSGAAPLTITSIGTAAPFPIAGRH